MVGAVRVPSEEMFGEGEFIPAAAVEEIGDELREIYGLPEVSVTYLWRKKGGKSSGRPVMGKCVKASGLAKYGIGTDFTIWFAADHCREAKLTPQQFRALVYHESLHAGVEVDDKTGNITPVLRAHDVEEFNDVVREFGNWDESLRLFAEAVKQAPLFETDTETASTDLAAIDRSVARSLVP